MAEHLPEEDAIAAVLFDWLSTHGYTIKDASGQVMVSTDQIREELVKIRRDNPSSGNTREGRRYNRAVDKMFGMVAYFEDIALGRRGI